MRSHLHIYSVICVGNRPIFLLRFLRRILYWIKLMFVNNITSDVLIRYSISSHWFSLYAVFKVHIWLIVYQSSEFKTSFGLWSLVNPALTALPCWLGWRWGIVVPPCRYLFLTSAADLPLSFSFKFGGHLLSHTVSSAVPSAVQVLTIVFGMGTGVTPGRIATKEFWSFLISQQ